MNIQKFHELFVYKDGVLIYRKYAGSKRPGDIAGSPGTKRYWRVAVDRKNLQAHRVIFAMHHGYMPEQVDHINGIKDDNRIENLRAATNAQNHWNTGLRSTNKSGVKGVYWHKGIKRWVASCRWNGKQHIVGTFSELSEAADAVEIFRLTHHGAYARNARAINSIKEQP